MNLTERAIHVSRTAPLPTGYVPEMTFSNHVDFMTRMHQQIDICVKYVLDTRPERCVAAGNCESNRMMPGHPRTTRKGLFKIGMI